MNFRWIRPPISFACRKHLLQLRASQYRVFRCRSMRSMVSCATIVIGMGCAVQRGSIVRPNAHLREGCIAVGEQRDGLRCTLSITNCGSTPVHIVDPFVPAQISFDGSVPGLRVRAVLEDGECATSSPASPDGWWSTLVFVSQMVTLPEPTRVLPPHVTISKVVDLYPILQTAYGHKLKSEPPSGWESHIECLAVRMTVITSGDATDYVEVKRSWHNPMNSKSAGQPCFDKLAPTTQGVSDGEMKRGRK